MSIARRVFPSRLALNSRAGSSNHAPLAKVSFTVDVYEEQFFDGRDLADSWRAAVRQAITEANRALQAATVGLVALVFVILRWGATLLLLAVAAKLAWKVGKRIWRA